MHDRRSGDRLKAGAGQARRKTGRCPLPQCVVGTTQFASLVGWLGVFRGRGSALFPGGDAPLHAHAVLTTEELVEIADPDRT